MNNVSRRLGWGPLSLAGVLTVAATARSWGAALAVLALAAGAVTVAQHLRLRRLAARLRFTEAVLEDLDAAVIACDAHGVVTVFNRTARALHGTDGAEVGPEGWIEEFDLEQIRAAGADEPGKLEELPLYRALHGEELRGIEVEMGRGGDRRVAAVNARPVHHGDELLGAVVVLHDVTERAEAARRLAFEALHDPLTGLANRALFLDRLARVEAQATRTGRSFAVLLIDLDDFKVVNDSRGHEAGDLLLVEAARRLLHAVREGDTAARLGGDEFAVLLEDADEADAREVADRILAATTEAVVVDGRHVRATVSIGISAHLPGAVGHGDQLRAADAALYRAKQQGKARVEVFEPSALPALADQTAVEADLRRALGTGALDVAYQPIVDLASQQPMAFEALVRWHHPTRGPIPAAWLIERAEHAGVLDALTEHVVRAAARAAAAWNGPAPDGRAVPVSVNLTGAQAQDPVLAERILRVLSDAGLDPELCVVEIQETDLLQVSGRPGGLAELRTAGVRLAVDGFGIGYSSVTALHATRPDFVKVARALVDPLPRTTRAHVVRTVLDLARNLGATSVAVGLERPEQLEFVRSHGCDAAQGFLLGRPIDAAAAARFARDVSERSTTG